MGVALWLEQYPEFNRLSLQADSFAKQGSDDLAYSRKVVLKFKESLGILHSDCASLELTKVLSNQEGTEELEPLIATMFTKEGAAVPLMNIAEYWIDVHPQSERKVAFYGKAHLKQAVA